MEATQKAKRPTVVFNGEAFDAIARPLGLDTREKQAAHLGVDPGNYSKIRNNAGVSAVFILRVHTRHPLIPVPHLFHEKPDQS